MPTPASRVGLLLVTLPFAVVAVLHVWPTAPFAFLADRGLASLMVGGGLLLLVIPVFAPTPRTVLEAGLVLFVVIYTFLWVFGWPP